MQVSKFYSGTLESIGSTGTRQASYGVPTTITTYPTKADFVNQTIADFLHDECGVDAVYEVRGSSSEKFLWIYSVPFLLAMPTGTSNFFNFYGPLNAAALLTGSSTITNAAYSALFSAYSSGIYSFTLYFTGNPKTGFALRIKGYSGTTISSTYIIRFVRAVNVGTQKDAVVWSYGNSSISGVGGVFGNTNGIDLEEDGTISESSFSTDSIYYQPSLRSKAINKINAAGKFPLVPVMAGVWKLSGMYYYLTGYGLTAAAASTIENQTEIQIAGRRFIVTTPETLAVGYINLGLMEVDD